MTTTVLLVIHSLLLLFCIIKILVLEGKLNQTDNLITTMVDIIRKAAKKVEDKEE